MKTQHGRPYSIASRSRFRPRLERLEERLAPDASLPEGFSETLVASGLSEPTALEFASDGRLFLTHQRGIVYVVRDGQMLEEPFVRIEVSPGGFRGLLGITVHPQFPKEPYVYLYYTVADAPEHNRVSRFTAVGDVADPASEEVLLELEPLKGPQDHHGGAMHFGLDGQLYIAVGENGVPSYAQQLDNLFGKVLRLNADGSVPEDNPYVGLKGVRPEIWAHGLRNPYTFAVQPGTGRIFVNDVGSKGPERREEVNDLVAGGNYGWPVYEGYTKDPDYVSPVLAYGPGFGGANCSINGGAFYNPAALQFPAEYEGAYFFADYCGSWIKRFDAASGQVTDFAADLTAYPVDLAVGPDGSLYYLAQGNDGALYRISYNAGAPAGGYGREDASVARGLATGTGREVHAIPTPESPSKGTLQAVSPLPGTCSAGTDARPVASQPREGTRAQRGQPPAPAMRQLGDFATWRKNSICNF